MANGIFEVYREHYSKMESKSLQDGEVVMRASDWHQFIDPASKIALLPTDLDNLGIDPSFTRQKIVLVLKSRLEDKRIPVMIQWTHNYILANETDDEVVSLDQVKRQAFESARSAIQQVIDFCGGEGILAMEEKKPDERPLTLLERIWHRITGKSKDCK